MTRGRALLLLAMGVSVVASCVERTLPGSSFAADESDARVAADAAPDGSRRRDAGAKRVVLESLPADGAREVPPSLRSIVFRIGDDVRQFDSTLVSSGARVLVSAAEARCELSGLSPAGRCAEVRIDAPLPRDTTCSLEVDTDGVRETISFRTADDDDTRAPVLAAPFPCSPDELPLVRACVRIEDVAVVLRVAPDEVSRCGARAESGAETETFYSGGVASLRIGGLVPEHHQLVFWWATDLAGNQAIDGPFAFATRGARAQLALSEVSSNPRGPEPAQEWIEVLSWASSDMDIGGFVIVDDSGDEAVLPEGSPLRPGQRAMIVPAGFDASDERDVLPAPGARLIRLESRSIGTAGLRNGGERLELRDREGRVVSRAPSVDIPAGQCLARVGAAEVDDPSAWERGGCTPGAPP